ncbi:MYG1 family protein [Patescibacteria group bacterium]
MKKIITHNGKFHADDVFAVATLQLVLEKEGEDFEVVRTRDKEIIKTGDIVVDVGGEYDIDKNLFDHHQIGGAGERKNGIPYAGFGLVWKHFGEQLCEFPEAAEKIDKKLVQSIDASDVGLDVATPIFEEFYMYTVGNVIRTFMPTWKEQEVDKDTAFLDAVKMARAILEREIKIAVDNIHGEQKVIETYNLAEDKRIIIFDEYCSGKTILNQFDEPLYAIFPSDDSDTWYVNVVRIGEDSFKSRKDLPESWAGKEGDELAEITGVKDKGLAKQHT